MAIATNIPQRLKTGFVVQGHKYLNELNDVMTKWLNGYTFNLGLMTDSCASLKPASVYDWLFINVWSCDKLCIATLEANTACPLACCHTPLQVMQVMRGWEIPTTEIVGEDLAATWRLRRKSNEGQTQECELLIQKHRCDMHEWQHYSRCQNNPMTSEWDTMNQTFFNTNIMF